MRKEDDDGCGRFTASNELKGGEELEVEEEEEDGADGGAVERRGVGVEE